MLLSIPGTPTPFQVLRSVQYGTVPGLPPWQERLYLDLLIPQTPIRRPAPAVVMFHGGGFSEGTLSAALYPWANPLFAAHGFVAVSVTYRLSRFAPFPAQIHDAKAAIRWCRANATKYGIDPERIGTWGHSAGGQLAALLGTSADIPELEGPCGSPGYSSAVQAVVAYSSAGDLGTWQVDDEDEPGSVMWMLFGGPASTKRDLARLASPSTHIRPGVPPFRLVHGDRDEVVPYSQTTDLAEALRGQGGLVEVQTIHGGYHNLQTDEYAELTNEPWTELNLEALRFFSRHLA